MITKKIALCNDLTVHMVPLPSAEPPEINADKTFERLTHSHTSKDHPNDNHPQNIYSNSTSTNSSTNNSPQTMLSSYMTSSLLSYNNSV